MAAACKAHQRRTLDEPLRATFLEKPMYMSAQVNKAERSDIIEGMTRYHQNNSEKDKRFNYLPSLSLPDQNFAFKQLLNTLPVFFSLERPLYLFCKLRFIALACLMHNPSNSPGGAQITIDKAPF
jgi:hypothetical protein